MFIPGLLLLRVALGSAEDLTALGFADSSGYLQKVLLCMAALLTLGSQGLEKKIHYFQISQSFLFGQVLQHGIAYQNSNL